MVQTLEFSWYLRSMHNISSLRITVTIDSSESKSVEYKKNVVLPLKCLHHQSFFQCMLVGLFHVLREIPNHRLNRTRRESLVALRCKRCCGAG